MRSACADHTLADACISDGARFCHVERICNLAHTSLLHSVVCILAAAATAWPYSVTLLPLSSRTRLAASAHCTSKGLAHT